MNLLPSYEIWTWIPRYEGRYEISNRGRLRSWIKNGGNSWKAGDKYRFLSTPRVKKPHINKFRYIKITIGSSNRRNEKNISIHREVALIYVPNPNPITKVEVNHINGNKSCNEWWNFEWVTRLESIDHAFRTGLIKPALGEAQSNTKLTNEQVLQIYNAKMKTTYLSMLFGISTHAIRDIKRGRTWWHLTGAKRHIKPSEIGRFKKQ